MVEGRKGAKRFVSGLTTKTDRQWGWRRAIPDNVALHIITEASAGRLQEPTFYLCTRYLAASRATPTDASDFPPPNGNVIFLFFIP